MLRELNYSYWSMQNLNYALPTSLHQQQLASSPSGLLSPFVGFLGQKEADVGLRSLTGKGWTRVLFQEGFLQIRPGYIILSDLEVEKDLGWKPETVEAEQSQMDAPFVDYPTALD